MTAYLCTTCGVQHTDAPEPPDACPICGDERQYVGHDGQGWTALAALGREHRARVEVQEPGLVGVGTDPGFAIGQRALLRQGPGGNLLWDCVPLLDDAREAVEAAGGVDVVALSHPHFQSTAAEWAEAFDARVLVHADDARWTMRPHRRIETWEGERIEPVAGTALVRTGGHFAGSAVCHFPDAAEGRGALLTGDTVQVVADRRRVGFMRSYPNLIPLSATAVARIADALAPLAFDRLYGGWWERVVPAGAAEAVRASAARHVAALEGRYDGV